MRASISLGLLAVIAAAAGAGLQPAPTAGAPVKPALDSAILFVGGPGSIDPQSGFVQPGAYAIDARGGRLKELASGGIVRARWSPDGRRLAFARFGATGGPDLYVVDATGGTPRFLARTAYFTWSPDSRSIAYSLDLGRETAIYVTSVPGRHRRLLTGRGGQFLSWSPDGKRIAFTRNNAALYVINANGTGRLRLARRFNVIQGYLSWSPSGRQLAFYPCCDKGFAIVNADGSHLRTLVGRGVLLPSWSPTGRLIALEGSVADRPGTFVVRPDGTGFTRISVLGDSPFTAAWSPDSRELVVDDRCCTPDLWVVPLAGGLSRQLTEGGRYGYGNYDPQWQPADRPTSKLGGRYVSPANPTDSVVQGDVVRTTTPVEHLSADGEQVVYASADSWCQAWTPRTSSLVRIRQCGGSDRTFGPAFASGRLAWSSVSSAMQGDNWTVWTATVDAPRVDPVAFPAGESTERNLPVTALAGEGKLLVFSTWGPCPVFINPLAPCVQQAKQDGVLWRVVESNAVQIASSTGALTPLSVDANRILVDHEDGTLELMSEDGRTLQTFHVYVGDFVGAKLQGHEVVVLKHATIADYDATSGALLHEWALPEADRQLEDVQNGIAVFVSGTDVHLFRLADGQDAVIPAPGTGPVHAQLEAGGLFYSYSVDDAQYSGRVAFVPRDQLPLR